jgi:hypothetical protein
MEGVTARVPIIEVVLTNYDARRRPFRNEVTVEPVECEGEPYFLATCTITLLSRRGRRFTLRRAPQRGAADSVSADIVDIPVTYERDFTADFTRLLCIPSLVEHILFCLDARWAAQASMVCLQWHRALAGPHAQQYWRQQCGRFWGVPTSQLCAAQDAPDWRKVFSHMQQQEENRAPRSTTEKPLLLESPHPGTSFADDNASAGALARASTPQTTLSGCTCAMRTDVQAVWEVPQSHHSVALDATADVAFDRSVRTERPLFVAQKGRGRSNPKRRGARQSSTWGVLPQTGPTGEPVWQVTPRNTAYFELSVCPPPGPIPEREPQSECVAVGFVNSDFVLEGRQPGWDPNTWYDARPMQNCSAVHLLSA